MREPSWYDCTHAKDTGKGGKGDGEEGGEEEGEEKPNPLGEVREARIFANVAA